jgi:uncharacterized protein with ParB-like and HNH nuclease domain
MANFKKTEDYTFAKLCKTFSRFEIPNFQRPYSWKNKQLQDFFNSIVENDKEYFIGNIVSVDHNPLKIIDGQQRLTTISLLLLAIRDLYLEISPKNKTEETIIEQREKSINAYLLYEDLDNVPAKIHKRLCLGKDKYQSVYEAITDDKIDQIDIKELGDNEKRILSNYNILKKITNEYISNSKIDRLEEILGKTLSLQIILIVCENDNDIYRIFEGFNSTGLGLSVADLVKNSVLMQSGDNIDIQNNVETSWLEMENLFESSNVSKFPKFLRHQWISENGYILMSNLFTQIKEEKIKNKSAKQILDYVNNLEDEAKIYLGIMYEQHEKLLNIDKKLLDIFKKFRFLRNDQVYEVLLAYYKAYKNKKIKQSSLQKYLKKIWIFVLRSRFISINPSEYEKIFASHCKNIVQVKDNKEFSKYFNIFIDKLKPLVRDDEQFIENFVSDVAYGNENKLIKETLIEIILQENKNIAVRDPEIEHILPKEPKKWNLTKTETREYINRLGNLTLLFEGDNKDVGNEKLDIKIKIYNNSGININKEISKKWKDIFKNDWQKAIDDRSIEIANKISKIWRL